MKSLAPVKNKYKDAIMKQYQRATQRSDAGGSGALTVTELKGVEYYTEALEKVEALEAQ